MAVEIYVDLEVGKTEQKVCLVVDGVVFTTLVPTDHALHIAKRTLDALGLLPVEKLITPLIKLGLQNLSLQADPHGLTDEGTLAFRYAQKWIAEL